MMKVYILQLLNAMEVCTEITSEITSIFKPYCVKPTHEPRHEKTNVLHMQK